MQRMARIDCNIKVVLSISINHNFQSRTVYFECINIWCVCSHCVFINTRVGVWELFVAGSAAVVVGQKEFIKFSMGMAEI